MKTLILMNPAVYADHFDDQRRTRLESLVSMLPVPPTPDALDIDPAVLADVECVLTSWGTAELNDERMARLPHLRLAVHCAGSIRNVVGHAAFAQGVRVSACAEANSVPVAEFTFAAIIMAGKKAPFLAADARVFRSDQSYRVGRGRMSNYGITVGIVGFSRIGRRVVERLHTLDDVTSLVYDPVCDPAEIIASGAQPVPLPDLLQRCDVLSIHAPALPSTYHLIGATELALLTDKATIINTARGSLIDTAALEVECASGRLNAILDVTDPEPLPDSSTLYDLPNVMITPHVAGSMGTEIRRMTDLALDEIERMTTGGVLQYEVRQADLPTMA